MLQALTPECEHNNDSRSRRPGTRPDAIVFAWVLDLPVEISSVEAARAILDVTRHQVSLYNPYQRSVVAELAKLIEKEAAEERASRSGPRGVAPSMRSGKKRLFNRQARVVKHEPKRNFVCLTGGLEQPDESTSEG